MSLVAASRRAVCRALQGGLPAGVPAASAALTPCTRAFFTGPDLGDDFASTSRMSSPSGFTRNQHRTNLPANLGIRIVPEQSVNVVERFGRFSRILPAGFHLLIPVVDAIRYVHSLKEQTLDIPNQNAITKDNVAVAIDGVLYVKVVDPYRASYGAEDALYAVLQLAQTTMRSELGKITLDKTFEERDSLNANIVKVINEASMAWGVECMRYEIRDISPPVGVRAAMELQAEAERRKRASILESEAEKQSAINVAEAKKQSVILASEALKTEAVNKAMGEAEGIKRVAEGTAVGLERMTLALSSSKAPQAVALHLTEQYIDAFSKIAKETNTVLLPADLAGGGAMAGGMGGSSTAGLIGQGMAIFNAMSERAEGLRVRAAAKDAGAKEVKPAEEEGAAEAAPSIESPAAPTERPISFEGTPRPTFSLQKP